MSHQENPRRLAPGHDVTVDDVRQLMGASTPHFALQLRERIVRLIRDLPADHPARLDGEREVARLDRLAFTGEVRGEPEEPRMPAMPAVADSVAGEDPGGR